MAHQTGNHSRPQSNFPTSIDSSVLAAYRAALALRLIKTDELDCRWAWIETTCQTSVALPLPSISSPVGTLFVDESGNPFCPRGPEVLSVCGVFAEGRGVSELRRHAEQARRRAALPTSELRYRQNDVRSKRYFFDEERLLRLPLRLWAVAVRVADMAGFRQKYDPRMLYEHLLYVLVSDVVCGLGRIPATIHFDPCSSFYSQRAFARRLQADFAGCRVAFAPDSEREKGLQVADMAAGAVRRHQSGMDSHHWEALARGCGATCRVMTEREVRKALQ